MQRKLSRISTQVSIFTTIWVLLLSAFLPLSTEAAASSKLSFAKIIGGTSTGREYNYATAANSNHVATAGSFRSTSVDFDEDNVVAGDTKSLSGSEYDISLVLYNTSGVLQWVKALGGTASDSGYSVAIDNSSNVYLAASFSSTSVDFDEDNVVAGDTLTNNGSFDVAIAKYNSSGVLQWAKAFGGTGYDDATSIAVDATGNIYISGTFLSANLDFDRGNVVSGDTLSPVNASYASFFAAKYNSTGTLQWVKTGGGSANNYASSIAVDGSGGVLVTGYFASSTFDMDAQNVVTGDTVTRTGPTDIFVAKYNSAGVFQFGLTPQSSAAYAVELDSSNNIYIGGYVNGSNVDFDENNVVSGDTITSSGFDAYVAKYNSTGTLQWVKPFGGSATEVAFGLSISGTTVFVTGGFDSTAVDFDRTNSIAGDTQYNGGNSGSADIFLASFNTTTANLNWVKTVGAATDDVAYSVAAVGADTAYLAGYVSLGKEVDFDKEYVVAGDTKQYNPDDAFLAKYSAPSNAALPIYRFWSNSFNGHFYTIDSGEKGYVENNYASTWSYEGPVFYAYPTNDCAGKSQVHRFWSTSLNSHFYTIDNAEKDFVIANYPTVWSYEGPAFCAYTTNEAGTSAVHRFWSDKFLNHFYTISTAEKDYVIANYSSDWTYEGVVYYAVP